MQAGGSEKEGKKYGHCVDRYVEWHFIVNNFYEWNFIVNGVFMNEIL